MQAPPSNPLLVAYASAGNGHRAAAHALQEHLAERRIPAVMADVLLFSVPVFRLMYSQLYGLLGEHAHLPCEAMYRLTDRPREKNSFLRMVEHLSARNIAPFLRFVEENRLRGALCTHFLPAGVLASLRDKGHFPGPVGACVTDYDLHHMWFHPAMDAYYVASPGVRQKLVDLGISPSRIHLTGIPVRRAFGFAAAKKIPAETPGPFRVLLSGSSVSPGKILAVLEALDELEEPLDVTLIAGRHAGLLEKTVSFSPQRSTLRLQRQGFVQNMEHFMAETHLFVTKPGGLTLSEAFAVGTPLLLYSPIPLQETQNARFVESQGAGILCDDAFALAETVQRLARDRKALGTLQRRSAALGHPDAAETIAGHFLAASRPAPETPPC